MFFGRIYNVERILSPSFTYCRLVFLEEVDAITSSLEFEWGLIAFYSSFGVTISFVYGSGLALLQAPQWYLCWYHILGLEGKYDFVGIVFRCSILLFCSSFFFVFFLLIHFFLLPPFLDLIPYSFWLSSSFSCYIRNTISFC